MNKFELTGEITDENIDAAVAFLKEHNGEDVALAIDSPGGSVFAGLKLLRAMDAFAGKITAEVGVMAASMAAFIALACDEIHLTKDSFVMTHQAWCVAEGNAAELRSTADLLEQASARLAEIVASKAKDAEAVESYMATDKWFNYQAMLEAFNNVSVVEEDRYNASIAATYSLIKERPAALIDLIAAKAAVEEEKEEEEKDEPEEDKPEEKEEEEEEKEEPKAKVDNSFAMEILAKSEKYI